MSQFIPGGGGWTVVDWTAHEIEVDGASVVSGAASGLETSVAGIYIFSMTMPYTAADASSDQARVEVRDPDESQNLNGAPTAMTWDTTGVAEAGFSHANGTPGVACNFFGNVYAEAHIAFGTALASTMYVWLRRNTGGVYADLPSRAILLTDPVSGLGSVSVGAEVNVQPGDTIEVWTQQLTGGEVIVGDAGWSNFRCTRLDVPTTTARCYVVDPTGTALPVAGQVFAGAWKDTLVLVGVTPLAAGSKIVTEVSTTWPNGVEVNGLAHGEITWVAPPSAWNPVSGSPPAH